MSDRDRFYAARDRRTIEYGVDRGFFEQPVTVVVGKQAAACAQGQLATLALVNMLARIHRVLHLDIPPAPLRHQPIVPASRLDEAVVHLARAIDPYIHIGGAQPSPCSIGLGGDAPRGLAWYAGATKQTCFLQQEPVPFGAHDVPALGACLAACLSASAILRQVIRDPIRPAQISLWSFAEGGSLAAEPEVLGSLDIGNVLQVGAGGVGSALAYWVREFGVRGQWVVLDQDAAELHNTNRCMGLLAGDAGWPSGAPVNKAVVAGQLFGADAVPVWYEAYNDPSFRPDLVLPLANERGVRYQVACRGEPLVLHATTSRLWEAQLHRHIPERDDCIACRMPELAPTAAFSCSTAPLPLRSGRSGDAALPFLSAAAGLMLLAGLYRLQFGDLSAGAHNFWALTFRDARRHVRRSVCACRDNCVTALPASVRRRIHARTRWSAVDAAAHCC